MEHMLGISTCWWHNRTERGDEIMGDILKLGLNGVELEYRITDYMYQQMRPQLKRDLKVLSIHNFFPKPEGFKNKKGSGDFFLLSSTDQDERLRAVEYSIRTMDYAHDLETEAVILHLGRVDIPNLISKFLKLYRSGEAERGELPALIDEQRLARETRHRKNLDAVLFSLDKLNREAERRGILLGIENRYYINEIPDFKEIGIILEKFRGGNIRYWHDVGHALTQENMGIICQKDLLEAYSEMLIGFHYHDVKGFDDHLAPGQGDMNYEEIKPFLQPHHIKVLEVHPEVDREDLMEGIRIINAMGIE